MYYCKNCGCRSQGDFCTNRKCQEFCKPDNYFPANDRSAVMPPCHNDQTALNDRNDANTMFYSGNRPNINEMPHMKMRDCSMPLPPCNEELAIAFATTPFQKLSKLYPLAKGLMAGTIFPELDMPYKERKILGDYKNA